MTFRWVDHTAELELEITADSEGAVFADAVSALAEVLATDSIASLEVATPREVVVEAPDRAAVLAEWLSELVYLSERDGFIAEGVEELTLTDGRVESTVAGRTGQARYLVKGVTYHRLMFEHSDDRWKARVIFDV